MIYNILSKLIARHLVVHLLIPLLVGLGIEVCIEQVQSHKELADVLTHMFSRERVGFFAGVIVTYLLIAGYLLWHETDIHVNPADLVRLRGLLKDAIEYFAISATRFKEWFEPYTQVYLADIVARQRKTTDFSHCRVQIFFQESQLTDVQSPYLDGLHAQAFNHLHQANQIPLGYLEPRELRQILSTLTPGELAKLHCISRLMSKMPRRVIDFRLRWRRRIKPLRFAIIKRTDKPDTLIKFHKHGVTLHLEFTDTPDDIAPYAKLVARIRETIMTSNKAFREEREFKILVENQ